MAKIDYMKDKMRLIEVKHSLEVKAKELNKEISLLYKSLRLAKKSVSEQKKLLKIAKVSLQQERMTQEEYLRYENALASAKANLYSIEAKLWEDKAQLAVIYGNNLKEIVR
jgi:outer membrane protein TolC